MNNPFFKDFKQPFDTVPFNEYKTENFLPAVKTAIEIAEDKIKIISTNTQKPTFENTIVALEVASENLEYITSIYGHLYSAEADTDLKKLAETIFPMLTLFKNKFMLNSELFKKIKYVYDNIDTYNVDEHDKKLTEELYSQFKRNGAELKNKDKENLKEIDQQLSTLSPKFSKNLLNAQNEYELWITSKEDLEGLPKGIVNAAAQGAKDKGKEGQWLFTLQMPSYMPFMTYSKKRHLREELTKAYGSICNGGKHNNNDVIRDIVSLKHKKANLLGFKNHAEYVLDRRMAKNIKNVYNLLDNLYEYSFPAAKNELDELKNYALDKDGIKDFSQWDLAYYKEKLKMDKYDFDTETLRPYFKAENVLEGIFLCANKLYGVSFKELTNIQTWHKDVKCFEVTENDNKHVGILYIDLFPRPTKRSGAWMNAILENGLFKGKVRRPHVLFVSNVTPSTKDQPSLLTFSEVRTIFHEFGHSLHGLLSDCKYRSIGGTSVLWDFVELPSQIMENWILEKDALKLFAKHYETGEIIPDELIAKIKDSSAFGAGYLSLRQLSLGYLDMAWYTTTKQIEDVEEFENNAIEKTKLFSAIPNSVISNSFGHIFSGGYSAGYYSYKWAEVLEADAFEKFKKDGIFNKDTAKSFRDNILSKGGLKHPMELYKAFRGREPRVEALLKKDRLIN